MGLHGELEFKRIVQSQIVKGFDPFLRPPSQIEKKIFLDFVTNSKTFLSCTFLLIFFSLYSLRDCESKITY